VIAAAGDIACASTTATGSGSTARCHQRATSDLLVTAGLSAVLPLGDAQYQYGTYSSFMKSYHPTWGRLKPITFPAAGNHEYKTPGAQGYFDYFNGAGVSTGPAGDRNKGYYSFDVGTWHLIALNSGDKCVPVACDKGSPQEQWLRADLAAHPASCTLAYWHHPRFNSGHAGNATYMQAMFQALYDADADVVLGGHAHDYERFAPQNPAGKLDNARGIRQFVVGTGGAFFTALGTTKPNSQVRNGSTYGVLMLTLHPNSYDWRFVPEAGKSFTDSGSQACHGLVPASPSPPISRAPRAELPKVRAYGQPAATCTIIGTPGDDVLAGTPHADVICGLDGNDRISGLAGEDLIAGGAGNDRIRGGGDRDELLGGRGRDVLFGGRGGDAMHGNFASDSLHGQSGNDRITGEGGRNRLYGEAGDDVLIASLNRRGVDRIYGGRGRDRAVVNRGDRVRSARRRTR
jgi:Ca2+-binding RTX toxin-like protein